MVLSMNNVLKIPIGLHDLAGSLNLNCPYPPCCTLSILGYWLLCPPPHEIKYNSLPARCVY